ncbi:MAG: hypothetical protein AAFQ65_01955 [Myxococcota bacterium]
MSATDERRTCVRLFALYALLAIVGLLCDLINDSELRGVYARAVPFVIVVSFGAAAVGQVLRDSLASISPLTWFLATGAVFFGFGPLMYEFATQSTIDLANALWVLTDRARFRVQLLNTVAFTFAFGAAAVFSSESVVRWASKSSSPRGRPAAEKVFWVSFAIGLPVRLLQAATHFGVLGLHLSQFTGSLANLTLAAVLAGAYLSSTGRTRLFLPTGALIALEVVIGLFSFDKSAALLPLAMLLLGVFWAKRSRKTVIVGAVLVAVFYSVLTPIVLEGRRLLWKGGEQDFSKLADFWSGAVGSDYSGRRPKHERAQVWWARLNYVNAQAFAMHLYDSGRDGHSFDDLAWFLVPRALYPDKPLVGGQGREISWLAHRQRKTSTGVTAFGEAYWNGGWPLVVLACMVLGAVVGLFTALAKGFLGTGQWFYLPFAFWAIDVSHSYRGWFTTSFVGAVLIMLAWFALVYLPVFHNWKPRRLRPSYRPI